MDDFESCKYVNSESVLSPFPTCFLWHLVRARSASQLSMGYVEKSGLAEGYQRQLLVDCFSFAIKQGEAICRGLPALASLPSTRTSLLG